jgi:hypothetical protein
VGIVIDFNPAWAGVQAEGVGNAVQQLRLGAVLGQPAAQLFAGIGQRPFHDLAFFAALGRGNFDSVSGPQGQRFGQQRLAGHVFRQQDQLGRDALVIKLTDKGFHNIGQRHVAVMAGKIRPVAPILASTEEEDLDAGMAAFAIGGEQIGFLKAGGIDALAGLDVAHRLDPVAKARCRFEVQRVRRRGHFRHQLVLHGTAFAMQEILCFPHQLSIGGLIEPADTRRTAALDLEQQAGAGARREHRVRTGAQQKCALQCVQGAGHRAGTGEGPEIEALRAFGAAMFQQLWKRVILAQQDVGKAFVVAIGHVVTRLELLDQVGFQQQRFGFRGGGNEEHLRCFGDHAGDAVIVAAAQGVAAHPLFQAVGLADIQHVARRIEHAIDARRVRQGFKIGGDAFGAFERRVHAPIY